MLISDLKEELAKRRMSQAELAKALGVTSGAVSMWLSGKRKIPDLVEVALRSIPKKRTTGDGAAA